MATDKTTRAVRNNNPLNIVRGSNWKGLVDETRRTDSRFCQFRTPAYGFRAAWYLMRVYIRKGYNTPRLIITRWCPDTTAPGYVRYVCKNAQIDADMRFRSIVKDKEDIANMMAEMAVYEGYNKSPETIMRECNEGYHLLYQST